MPDTIESFVAKLQSEGVESGRREGERIRDEARREAEAIIQKARSQAEQIVADARREAETLVARGRTELELASRDVVLRLRESIARVLEELLLLNAREALRDPDLIRGILRDLVAKYAAADIEGGDLMRIDLEPDMKQQLVDWALSEIADLRRKGSTLSIDLQGTLKQAGFEYEVAGATIEVTEKAAAQCLMDLVAPHLREAIEKALQKE